MAPQRRSAKTLNRQVSEWNAAHPVGTEVVYHSVIGGPPTKRSRTRTEAYVLSGHTAVVFIENHSGCVALDALSIPTGEDSNGTAA